MTYNFHSDLSNDISQLLGAEIDYNVVIKVGPNPSESKSKSQRQESSQLPNEKKINKAKKYEEFAFKEYRLHSSILRIRSKYFNQMFAKNEVEKVNGIYYIKMAHITPQTFDIIISYIYGGNINLTNKDGAELLDIIITSNEFMLEKLIKTAEDLIIKNYSQFIQNDPVGIFQRICYHKSLVNLFSFCFDAICNEPQTLFKSDKFIQFPAPLLEVILKRDDLNLDEIEIWENLIKWGLAQFTSRNHTSYTFNQKDHQEELKRILHKFIPLIRFHEISSSDFINKVKPYEVLLSKELCDDILKFHMVTGYVPTLRTLSPRCANVDSCIINRNHIALFSSWINNENDFISYEFNLLYRDSRDRGNYWFRNDAFHRKCDNKGATIFVAKIKGTNQIVGGYNPLDWKSGFFSGYKSTSNSFIFYFEDYRNINTGKIGRVINPTYAIQCSPIFGPSFGEYIYSFDNTGDYNFMKPNGRLSIGGCNLMIKETGEWRAISLNSHSTKRTSYPNIGIPNCFEVDDYEVFQVCKKAAGNALKNN